MKCFAVLLIVAIASFALAVANPIDVESIEPTKTKETEAVEAEPTSVRDKRTLFFGASPYVAAAPLAYSAYTAPLAYSAYSAPYTSYSPYTYSSYSAYPYYASPYYYV